MDKGNRIKYLNIVCALLLLVSAVIVFRINQNSHLYSDDYLYSFKFNPGFTHADPATLSYEKITSVGDYLSSLSLLYHNLTGRIVPHALLQFFLLMPAWVFDVLNTLALFALTLLMSTWLLGGQRRLLLPWWLLMSILYYLAVFSTIPNLYLPAFSFNYLWTSLIIFVFLIPVRSYISSPGASSPKIGFALIMLLGGLIAGDTNEPVIPALLMAMGGLGLWKLYRDKSLPLWYVFAGVGVTLGFAFLFFAPGNTQRALYETQNAGSRSIGFGLGNLKAILFSSVTTFPAALMAFLGLLGMKRRPDAASIPPFAFMLLMFGGTVFALLFSPLYIARMNILFVGFLLILLLQISSRSKFHSATWLFACILALAPFYALKLSADFHRMDRANREYALFRQQIAECPNDSCLVNPRAYLDPITRENWAKPMAEYYGLKYLWIKDELSDENLSAWKDVSYRMQDADSTGNITLQGLRYVDHDAYSRTLYVLLRFKNEATAPEAVSLMLFTKDLSPKWLRRLYERIPQGIRDVLLTQEPSYRPQIQKELDGIHIYALPMRIEDWQDDYLRLRVSAGNQRVQDFRMREVIYSQD